MRRLLRRHIKKAKCAWDAGYAMTAKHNPFDVLSATRSCQATKMTLLAGGTSDDAVGNEHPRSEQWLFVLSGSGEVVIGGKHSTLRRIKLRRGVTY